MLAASMLGLTRFRTNANRPVVGFKENRPEWQRSEFEALKANELKVCRAWGIKENLRRLWDYLDEVSMWRHFKRWYFLVTHFRLAPIKKEAQTLKSHLDNILTYARHRITKPLAKGINTKIDKIKLTECAFRNRAHYHTVIYFYSGDFGLFPHPPQLPLSNSNELEPCIWGVPTKMSNAGIKRRK
jgi:hypothetical protein